MPKLFKEKLLNEEKNKQYDLNSCFLITNPQLPLF